MEGQGSRKVASKRDREDKPWDFFILKPKARSSEEKEKDQKNSSPSNDRIVKSIHGLVQTLEENLSKSEQEISQFKKKQRKLEDTMKKKDIKISELKLLLKQSLAKLVDQEKMLDHLRGTNIDSLNVEQVNNLLKEVKTAKYKLSERKDKLQDSAGKCAICLDNEANMLVEDCKHCCLCNPCSIGMKSCPICQIQITKITLIYRV